MSLYYWFSEKQEYVKHDKAMEHKRYMYDPVTDSYVENISVLEKERYLHNKYGRYGFNDFYHVLNELVSEKHPNIERRILLSGDYIFDNEVELICSNQRIRYSPYAMFVLSVSPEDTIDSFLHMLEKMTK